MANIQLFNTLTGKKEPLHTLKPGVVKMYCCGVTPYSNTHIGHCRTFFSYDLLYRTLKDANLEVEWARNITDVDDKIIKRANDENVSCETIVNRYVQEQDDMLDAFNFLRPQYEPKVTDTIPQIIEHIEALIKKEFAYTSSTGVYYRLRKFPNYGNLSKNNVDELRKGVRIDVDDSKEDPLDFALWKFAKPGELKWPSPWGEGRPGWHIECSAMVHNLFGDQIDIHMGGRDLIFPHHEAEIAQSEAKTGKQFSKFWMYGGMLTSSGEKMSKSLNNFISIKDYLEKYPPEVLRLMYLSASYTAPLDFTYELAEENLKKLARIYRFVELMNGLNTTEKRAGNTWNTPVFKGIETLVARMRETMADDLNSAAALAQFFDFIKHVNTELSAMEKKGAMLSDTDVAQYATHWNPVLTWLRSTLGLLANTPAEFFKTLSTYKISKEISPEQIEQKITERNTARTQKEWKRSDEIRDELLANGIQIQDTPNGTKWTVQI